MLMRPKTKNIESVIRDALRRYEKGKEEHGDLDLSIDKRDFLREAENELLDVINYAVFQVLRLRGIKSKNSYKTVTGICKARNNKAL